MGEEYNEGDVVSFYSPINDQISTARVRRVYDDELELVNREIGSLLVKKERVIEIIGEIIPGSWDMRPKL